MTNNLNYSASPCGPRCFAPCLVFNHPRFGGWSLHGQVYFTFFFLSSSSLGLQSSNGIPVHSSMLSIHCILWFPLSSCSRYSALHDLFLQTISFFSHPKYDNFLLLIMYLC